MTVARRPRVGVFLAALLTIAATTACGRGGPDPAEPDHDAAPPPPVVAASAGGPGPSGTVGTVPVGYTRDEAGAAAAATSYLSVLHGLVELDPDARRQALVRIAAPGADAAIQTGLDSLAILDRVLEDARQVQPEAGSFVRDIPVGYRVEQHSADRARVGVWSVGIVLIEGRTLATEVWSTNTVDLVWESDDWRVWSWARTPGPQPAVSAESEPTPPAQLLATVGGWEGYRYVPE